tara:strand:+ start:9319 stop:9966 length:648 start_codon:yes stop_codon:yes gene_type:complete
MIINILYLYALSLHKIPCIVFFSGGSNLISSNFYSNFLDNFNNKYKLYKVPFTFNNKKNSYFSEILIDELSTKHDKIIFIGHSSGCTTAINKCNDKVNKLILLDPVKTPYYSYNVNLEYLNEILVLNADKSYKWSKIPPFVPFIPFFKINPNELNIDNNKIKVITLHEYGHSDIINNPWRDIMHYSRLSIGYNERDYIKNYHKILYNISDSFIEL